MCSIFNLTRKTIVWVCVVAITCLFNVGVLAGEIGAGKRVIEPFDYNGVSLDSSRLKTQVDEVKNEYLRISNDDLLKGFRKRAGLPAPGVELGGWYTNDFFNIFGQIIGGLSRMYAATGDEACRTKANYLIGEWAKTIDSNGYFYYSNKRNAEHYIYEKMVGGLLDAYQYCGNKQALECLSRITGWAVKHLDRERRYAKSNPNRATVEWFTLSENLYRAYLLTGDVTYKDFGKVWEYTEFWDIFAKNGDIFSRWQDYHAYSHVNAVNGAATAYLVYGQKHYLDTMINGYDYLTTHQTYATGGYGHAERFKPSYDVLVNTLKDEGHFETQCGSWAVFKLCKYLISFTGDARYGDWIELLTYNGIGASPAMDPPGSVQYFSTYNLYGSYKINNNGTWTCCAGSRPEAVADYYDLIWFKDAANLYVNLYTPSTVRWNCKGTAIAVSQKGVLEDDKGMEFTVAAKSAVPFGMKFRVPGWVAAPMKVTVNGKEFEAKADSKHWLAVNRTWADGDKIMVTIPLGLYAKRLDPAKVYPSAVMYGPIVLTGTYAARQQASTLDMNDVSGKLEPASGGIATFCLKADKVVVFRPYYSLTPAEEYVMYIDPHMTDLGEIKFTGTWNERGKVHFGSEPNAIAECDFTGTGVIWKGEKTANGGKAEVSIDGKAAAVVDQYNSDGKPAFEWRQGDLAAGKHVIRIRVLKDKNESSKGYAINIRNLTPIN